MAKLSSRVERISNLANAMLKERKRRARGLEVGMYRAGLFIQRESQKIVPIDESNLKPSANTRKEGSGFESVVIVSYGTEYAVYVHEDLNAQHAPGKEAKYLENVIKRYPKQIMDKVRSAM